MTIWALVKILSTKQGRNLTVELKHHIIIIIIIIISFILPIF